MPIGSVMSPGVAVVVDDAVDGAPALHAAPVGGHEPCRWRRSVNAPARVYSCWPAVLDDEEAVALDHDVGRAAGGLRSSPGLKLRRSPATLHAEADLRGVDAAEAAAAVRRAARTIWLRSVLEDDVAGLVADRVDVGDVVADRCPSSSGGHEDRRCRRTVERSMGIPPGTGWDQAVVVEPGVPAAGVAGTVTGLGALTLSTAERATSVPPTSRTGPLASSFVPETTPVAVAPLESV